MNKPKFFLPTAFKGLGYIATVVGCITVAFWLGHVVVTLVDFVDHLVKSQNLFP